MTGTREPRGFWLMAVALPMLMASSVAPSPVYVVYQEQWGFSAATLTLVYAVYMAPLVLALLTVGGLSDIIGRRPVVTISLLVQAMSMLVFVTASGVEGLVVARVLQGLATGAAMGAVTSGLFDLAPPRRRHLGALLNGIGPAIGIGIGASGSGLLVEFAPGPTVTVYLALAAVFVVLAVAAALRLEPATRPNGRRVSLWPRISIPVPARRGFLLLLPGVVASAAVGGLYNSLAGSLSVEVLGESSKAVGGFAIAVLQVAAVGTSALTRPGAVPNRLVLWGSIALAAGVSLIAVALFLGSTPVFFAGTALAGAGYGALYLGAVRMVALMAPPGQRAEPLAALNVVNYLSLSVPTLVAGTAIARIGLQETAVAYCLTMLALAVASAAATRTRSERPESGRETPAGGADAKARPEFPGRGLDEGDPGHTV
jgi:MFS family permease